MDALPYIVQIAFFGAAGSSFVLAHLKNLRANAGQDVPPGARWRFFRHPHRAGAESPEQKALRRAAALQTAWGFCYLGGALATPLVFRAFSPGGA